LNPMLHIALVDDWEVRGNGSGHPRVLQFEPIRRLMEIFERFGVRGSFNVELLQQLTYRKYQDQNPELEEIADEWDATVQDAYRRGHDIEPHLHTQWSEVTYCGNLQWKLAGKWSVLEYSENEIRSMIGTAIRYLLDLLRQVDSGYKCVSYRAGAWCAAPSDALFPILAEFGFELDQSMVAGLRQDTPHVKIDYTICEEDFLPYYPVMTDARRISSKPEPIICIPTHTFRLNPRAMLARDMNRTWKEVQRRLANKKAERSGDRGGTITEWTDRKHAGLKGKLRKLASRYTTSQLQISDLSRFDFNSMKVMLADIRRRARETGLPTVPVILENHSKDILDFSDIECFVALIAKAEDIRVLTLSEIAGGLKKGDYAVLTQKREGAHHSVKEVVAR